MCTLLLCLVHMKCVTLLMMKDINQQNAVSFLLLASSVKAIFSEGFTKTLGTGVYFQLMASLRS